MIRVLLLIFAFFSLLIPLQLQAATPTENIRDKYITLNLPETVVARALEHALPLSLKGSSSMLDGTITIVTISNFRVKKQQIFCHLDLVGSNLHLVTKVANQNIRLKLGSARVTFDCEVRIRYDKTRQILYIRPTSRGAQGTDALSKGDISQALALLLNGQEFPIAMQNIKPIIAEASDKIITIKTDIVDIKAIKGALQISLNQLSPHRNAKTQPHHKPLQRRKK